MKHILQFALLVIGTTATWGNTIFSQVVSFSVIDSNDRQPLVAAHVMAVPLANNGKVQYELSGIDGKCNLPLRGKYALKVFYLGYLDYTDTLSFDKDQSITIALAPDVLNLTNVVVSGSARPSSLDQTLYPIRVIERKTIEARGAINLRDLLLQELNIKISQDAVLGSGISMMGVGGENVKILLDGVPIIGRLDGNIDISQLNLNNIERVEIIEGPASVFYGSNALGGVINLVSKNNQNHTLETNLRGYYESVGQYNADLDIGWKNKGHMILVSGGRNFFDGFTTRDTLRRFMEWKPKEQYFSDFQYRYAKNKFIIQSGHHFFREMIQAKGTPDKPFEITATDQYFRTIRYSGDLQLKKFIKKYHVIDMQFSYSYFQRRRQSFFKDLVTLDQTLFDENTDEFQQWMTRDVYGFSGKYKWFNFQGGIDFNIETARGPRIQNEFQWIGDFAGFAEFEFLPVKWLTMKPGIRYSYNTAYQSIPTPAMHIKISPAKNVDMRFSYARGFRAPSLKELYFIFVDINHNIYGNANLQAEQSHSANASFKYKWEKKAWRGGAQLTGYYNDIDNQIRNVAISITPDSNIYRYENISNFKGFGGGIQLDVAHTYVEFAAGAIMNGVKNSINPAVLGENRFVYYPEFTFRAQGNIPRIKGSISLFLKYSGQQPFLYTAYDADLQTDVIREGYMSGFPLLDVSYTQKLFKESLVVVLYGKNLCNIRNVNQTIGANQTAHTESSSSVLTAWGASFGISVKYQFRYKKVETKS